MKRILYSPTLIMMILLSSLFSCSSSSDKSEDKPVVPDTPKDTTQTVVVPKGQQLFNQVRTELFDYLESHGDATIERLQDQLHKYSSELTTEVLSDILYVHIDTLEFVCDPYCLTGIVEEEADESGTEDVLKEMSEALFPEEGYVRNNTWAPSYAKTRAATTGTILNKRKVLLWDPFALSDLQNKWERSVNLPKSSVDLVSYVGNNARTSQIQNFDDYDVVYMCCHGDSKGNIYIPSTPSSCDILSGTGSKTTAGKVLSESELESLLPNDLSKTALWAAICFGDKTKLKDLVSRRNCVAFAGPDNACNTAVVETPFVRFVNALFAYSNTVYNATKDGLFDTAEYKDDNLWHFTGTPTESGNKITMRYKNMPYSQGGNNKINGQFVVSFNNKNAATAPLVLPKSEVDGQPRASLTMPYEMFSSASGTRATTSTVSAGFWIKNKDTKEEVEIEFSKSTVIQYLEPYYYPSNQYKDKEIVRVEVLGITDDLEEGDYEYKTYLTIDGSKEYSNETYEFSVKKIYSVVPEWILDMMDPYIPIYDGINPPTVEGTYLISPMTLYYNSVGDYDPGTVFADTYVMFYNQDRVQNKIDFAEIEVNSSGNILAESYGPGAFISGEGNNFSIFFNTTGESYYDDGTVTSKTALVISGTMGSGGIENVHYAFVMVDKNDPNHHVIDVGEFRVFVDGDGFSQYIDVSARTRGTSKSSIHDSWQRIVNSAPWAPSRKGTNISIYNKK